MSSIKNILNDPGYNSSTNLWHGLSVIPSLTICSPYNDQYQKRKLIASIGIPEEAKDQIINNSLEFKNIINFELTNERFKEFDSIEETDNYIKDPFYKADPNN